MSITYDIKTKISKYISYSAFGDACWSNYRPPRRAKEWVTEFHIDSMKKKRNVFYDRVFDQLVGHWLSSGWMHEVRGKYGHRIRLEYTSDCPFWVMILTSSVYRIFDESTSFRETWEKLEKWQEDLDYSMNPWTMYALCVVSKFDEGGNLTRHMTSSHLPVSGANITEGGVFQLAQWNARKLKELLPPMGERATVRTKSQIPPERRDYPRHVAWYLKALTFNGRDHFFCGGHEHPGGEYWPFNQRQSLSIKEKQPEYSWQYPTITVEPTDLILNYIKPNNL